MMINCLCKRTGYKLFFGLIFLLSVSSCSILEDEPDYNFPEAYALLSPEDSSFLHFFVISDWGFSGSENQLKVADEMSTVSSIIGIRFILTCGDNFQIAGVKSTEDMLWESNYENVYNDSSLQVPWYPVLGNHDYLGNPYAEVAYSQENARWNMPARYYTFVQPVDSFSSVRFIMLDTPDLISAYRDLPDGQSPDSIAQYRWFKSIISANTEKWVIVVGHHPVFSASDVHGDTKELKILVKPLLDRYKADLYLSGHDHDFEHARENGKYTDYIVTGTGGSLREAGENSRTVFSLSQLGFTYISVSRHTLELSFLNTNGELAYYLEKCKN
jgi:acid phosphatase